jgi:hypothetical protein
MAWAMLSMIIKDASSSRNSSQAGYDITGINDVGIPFMLVSGRGPQNKGGDYYPVKNRLESTEFQATLISPVWQSAF